ncbi:MAG TPA: glucuronate isomerase, partial [Clostridiales bacterium]|nr:glucuronate isomerase [Clostridiales bacterium]
MRYIHENFLLNNKTAEVLFHEYAKNMPIIDYHCHLSPKEVAEDKTYSSITEAWLGGDHYKWRAMRSNGVAEEYVTGNAPDAEKFRKWAETLPYLMGNPLHHWAHLELKRFFGIDDVLGPDTADTIFEHCNEVLRQPDFTARNLILRSRVEVVCTTDDPVDSLKYHRAIAADPSFAVKVYPAFRPDKALSILNPAFREYISRLSDVSGLSITDIDSLKTAISRRMDFFAANGCSISDHGLDPWVFSPAAAKNPALGEAVLKKVLAGGEASFDESVEYRTVVMIFLGQEYARRGWVMQLHIGTQRNINSAMFSRLGPDTGFDTIADDVFGRALAGMLDAIESSGGLPKTIVYNNNPRENEMIASILGAFQ